jgi:hypothetical protein
MMGKRGPSLNAITFLALHNLLPILNILLEVYCLGVHYLRFGLTSTLDTFVVAPRQSDLEAQFQLLKRLKRKLKHLFAELHGQFPESAKLVAQIRSNLKGLGNGE